MKSVVTYSQNKEDIILASMLGDVNDGFYVDVGAHHPVFDSVTKYFYNKGWTGINIEPIKKYHSLLGADRPKDTNLNIGVGESPGTLKLREYLSEAGEGMSTFSESTKINYENNKHWATNEFEEYLVEIIPLSKIFEDNWIDNDNSFMKVDVEGLEYEVLKGNDWKKYRPKILCIESNHMVRNWKNILTTNGYEVIFNDGLNGYYVDKQKFPDFSYSYSENLLMQFPSIVHWSIEKTLLQKTNETEKLEELLNILEKDRTSDNQLVSSMGIKLKIREVILSIDNRIKILQHHKSRRPKQIKDINGVYSAMVVNTIKTKYTISIQKKVLLTFYQIVKKLLGPIFFKLRATQ
jgi:FkbM family methyltransferase